MEIKILGCENTKGEMLALNTEKALLALGIQADLSLTEDYLEVLQYGVMTTPCLIIDGQVRSVGQSPDVNDIKKLLML